MKREEYIYALRDFDFILRYFPNHLKGLLMMGDLSIRMHQPEQAVPYFERAIVLYPHTASTYVVYGIVLYKLGKLKEAAKEYKCAIKLQPNSAETHYNLGLAYLGLRDYKRANEEAQKAYGTNNPRLLPTRRSSTRLPTPNPAVTSTTPSASRSRPCR